MLGLMQNQPLLISMLLAFAERHHGDGEIVSRRVEGDIHRYTYRDLAGRARQLANTLATVMPNSNSPAASAGSVLTGYCMAGGRRVLLMGIDQACRRTCAQQAGRAIRRA